VVRDVDQNVCTVPQTTANSEMFSSLWLIRPDGQRRTDLTARELSHRDVPRSLPRS
jgi:hypothetical protein